MKPKARQRQLLVQEVGDELVVYDQARNKAHRLNRTAAIVWRHCDGQNKVADLTGVLQRELDPSADDDLVWVSLDRLETAHLFQDPIGRSADQRRSSRRRFLEKVGRIAMLSLLVPVVESVVAPTAAQARSHHTHTPPPRPRPRPRPRL
jgi:hypothetical protein